MGRCSPQTLDGVEALLFQACADLSVAARAEVRFECAPQRLWSARLIWPSPDRVMRGEWIEAACDQVPPSFGLVRFFAPAPPAFRRWVVDARLSTTGAGRAFAARPFRVTRAD